MKLVKAREEEFKFNTGPEILTITKEGILVDDLTAQMLESRVPVTVEDFSVLENQVSVDETTEVVEEIAPEEAPVKTKKTKK